jgi:lipoate-protein ligase A
MRLLDLTLPTLAENLALDEALLDEAERADAPPETLRIWEAPRPGVVIGRSSHVSIEVRGETCRELDVPVLRRISGGAAVVVGPGCLMYALVLSLRRRPELRAIDRTHAFVLGRIAAALQPMAPGVTARGICDLAIDDKKFSGSGVRAKRNALLYHGTLLYGFPLEMVGRLLATPPREPKYRQGREHDAFVTNLPLDAAALRSALRSAWEANEPCPAWPRAETARLAAEKYSRREWNEQL